MLSWCPGGEYRFPVHLRNLRNLRIEIRGFCFSVFCGDALFAFDFNLRNLRNLWIKICGFCF
jgi:hypothetical protein